MRKIGRSVILLFFVAVLVFSLWKLWGILCSYQEGKNSYRDLEQYISFDKSMEATAEDAVPETEKNVENAMQAEATEEADISMLPCVDFNQLSKINPDIVGWIVIEGTNINYPVVQGDNDDYYLTHLFDGTYNGAGCIFLDSDCEPDFSGRHSIIYGHNMKDKSMFANLVEYKNQEFYNTHPTAILITPDMYYKIHFFSGYVSDTWANAWDLSFNDYEYLDWLHELQRKSCFTTECVPTKADRVLTLSTCTYEFDTAKFVLHGYLSELKENKQ